MNEEEIQKCCTSPSTWVCPKEDCKKVLSRKQTLISHLMNIHNSEGE